MSTAVEKVRLHISPLTPESYSIIVPASLHDSVSAVEYRHIPTFPEKNYGYLDLPQAEADRLKKRINGALVKGARIKVEPARPKKPALLTKEDVQSEVSPRSRVERSNVDDEVLRGLQLPNSRRVRRGWTEPAMAKTAKRDKAASKDLTKKSKAEKSKYTDKEEVLFKTKMKNVESVKESGKKRKRGDDTTIIHEFKQTTKFPTFLRGQTVDKSKSTADYDAEKGWVDESGIVVEGPRRSRRKQSDASAQQTAKKATSEVTKAAKKLTLQPAKSKPQTPPPAEDSDEETSSSGSSAGEDDDVESEDENELPQSKSASTKETSKSDRDAQQPEDEPEPRATANLTVETTPKPERSIPSLEIQPTSAASEQVAEVHPLEALFKRPRGSAKKPPGLELKIPQTFTFFGNDDIESEDGDVPTALPLLPQTPFTQADMRFRRERSAAPTPDTAAPTKLLFGPVMDQPLPTGDAKENDDESGEDEEAGDDDDDDDDEKSGSDAKKGRSEFADKWFWENRGDNNRAWKKRRREVTKQKRYEGNKRRTRSSAP